MYEKTGDPDSDLTKTLGLNKVPGRGKRRKRVIVLLIAAVAAAGAVWFARDSGNGGGDVRYTTQEARPGNLTVTVTASGSVQPTNQVDVGSELSGKVKSVEADYNDQVKAGRVLARLDTTKLDAQVLQSRAALESARAKSLQVEATIEEARSQLKRLEQLGKLGGSKAVSQYDLDSAKANLARARADKSAAEAAVSQRLPPGSRASSSGPRWPMR